MKAHTLTLDAHEVTRVSLALAQAISSAEWMANYHGTETPEYASVLRAIKDRLGHYPALLREEYVAWQAGEITDISPEAMRVGPK